MHVDLTALSPVLYQTCLQAKRFGENTGYWGSGGCVNIAYHGLRLCLVRVLTERHVVGAQLGSSMDAYVQFSNAVMHEVMQRQNLHR